ncbi:hypothetical protein L798_09176 [Zootermopsis nevadensis]|uniref:Uncharacterized protein n=1 Tax=Zootermopsis nevadensis TaxID=136037 RepID=A0A067RA60_ZOONE|nr:hypothetical protein L798_09176 [Zootermopsis nevadensis]
MTRQDNTTFSTLHFEGDVQIRWTCSRLALRGGKTADLATQNKSQKNKTSSSTTTDTLVTRYHRPQKQKLLRDPQLIRRDDQEAVRVPRPLLDWDSDLHQQKLCSTPITRQTISVPRWTPPPLSCAGRRLSRAAPST